MKKSKYLMILIALMLVVALVSVVACGKEEVTPPDQTDNGTTAPTKTLKIGFIMPMSGGGSLWGIAIQKHVNAYTAVVNEAGGLKVGDDIYMVENYFADDQGTPDNAAKATNELIEKDGVQAILGYWGVALPTIANITTPKKIILNVTKPTVNYDAKLMPYAAFSHDDSFLAFAQLSTILKAFPNTKTMGVSADEVYYAGGGPTVEKFKELLAEQGIKYFEDVYPWGILDYTTHIDKLKKAGVDTIFSWASPEEEAMKEKEIFEKGYDMAFAGAGTVVDLKSYIDISGYDAAQGGLHPYNYPWDLKTYNIQPEIVDLALKIKAMDEKMEGKPFDYDGAFPYGLNSMLMYFQALEKAGTIDADAVMAATEGGTFDLFSGTQTLGGTETYGRAVFGAPIGPMGKVVDYHTEYFAEGPAYAVP